MVTIWLLQTEWVEMSPIIQSPYAHSEQNIEISKFYYRMVTLNISWKDFSWVPVSWVAF